MDRADHDLEPRKPTPRTVGIIGKRVITQQERTSLHLAGKFIARLGHTVQTIPQKGVSEAVVRGVESEGGNTRQLDANVIEKSDVTFVYPDTRLLTRLLAVYPNLRSNERVIVIEEGQLQHLTDALVTILEERHLL